MNKPILTQESGIWKLRDADSSRLLWKERDETRVKGVTYDKRTGKYMAQIRFEGKNKNLGYFETQEQAAAKYRAFSEYIEAIKSNKQEEKQDPVEKVELF